jgi:sensor domain CHASE-containing protein
MKTPTLLLVVIVLLVIIVAAGCISPESPQDQPGVTSSVTGPAADLAAARDRFTADVNATLQEIDQNLAAAASDLGRTGIAGPEANATLNRLAASLHPATNAITVTPAGLISAVARSPEDDALVGISVADQTHVRQALLEHRPLMSGVFLAVEGFDAVVIQRPVTDGNGTFLGLVSVLLEPQQLLAESASRSLAGTDFTAWAMDTSGRLIYDRDPGDLVGRTLITDPLFADYPGLLALSKRMLVEPAGSAPYTFTAAGGGPAVRKDAVWSTAGLHGTGWRLVVAREI